MHVHKNDTVLVISGNSLGKQGKVLKVYPDKSRVIIENVNIVKRHARPTQKNPQGGIVQKEGPISAANVMVICPKCSKDFPDGHLGAYRVEVSLKKDINDVMTKSRDALTSAIETMSPPYPERGWLCSYCQYNLTCEAEGD